jgi:hypothetical protein
MGEDNKPLATFSVINIDLSKISDVGKLLIEKISNAIALLAYPWIVRRNAQADADVDKIQTVANIQVTELEKRAMVRLFCEEAKKQENIENITRKALPNLKEDAHPQNISNDWIVNFFDKGRLISDEQMQNLWAKLLAEEANSQRKYSKNTVNILSMMDNEDAELFNDLCSYCWTIENEKFLTIPINDSAEIYLEYKKINLAKLMHLEGLGLIKLFKSDVCQCKFTRSKYPVVRANYFGKSVEFSFSTLEESPDVPEYFYLDNGNVVLTQCGFELSLLTNPTPLDGLFEYIVERWHCPAGIKKKVHDSGE